MTKPIDISKWSEEKLKVERAKAFVSILDKLKQGYKLYLAYDYDKNGFIFYDKEDDLVITQGIAPTADGMAYWIRKAEDFGTKRSPYSESDKLLAEEYIMLHGFETEYCRMRFVKDDVVPLYYTSDYYMRRNK